MSLNTNQILTTRMDDFNKKMKTIRVTPPPGTMARVEVEVATNEAIHRRFR
jgi:hypothetical protein